MIDRQEHWQDAWEDTPAASPPESEAMSLAAAIFCYGGMGILLLAWLGFCGWLALQMHDQMLDPTADSRGYGRLLDYLRDAFGVWPTTAMFFAFLQIPILAIYLEVRRKMRAELDSENLPTVEPWIPRLSDDTAKKLLIALFVLFQGAAAAILFNLLPTGLCAIVLVATPPLALAIKARQRNVD